MDTKQLEMIQEKLKTILSTMQEQYKVEQDDDSSDVCNACIEEENLHDIEDAIQGALEYSEEAFIKFIELRGQLVNKEIQKLTTDDRYLTREEVSALLMLRGRQRELNSIMEKLKTKNMCQMIMDEEERTCKSCY